MALPSSTAYKRPRHLWWLVGLLAFTVCLLLQMPAAWILPKLSPNNPYIVQVTGNVWQGNAVWQLPKLRSPLLGSLQWQWQPWRLLTGRYAADVTIDSGDTHLQGMAGVTPNTRQVSDLSGRVGALTLAQLVDWQVPDAPIAVNAVDITKTKQGFSDADGQLTWVGGAMAYPSGGQVYHLTLPSMKAALTSEDNKGKQRLHANLSNNNNQRLGDLYLDQTGMLDVGLTQRLLKSMPDFQNQAPDDTTVINVRQPLFASAGDN